MTNEWLVIQIQQGDKGKINELWNQIVDYVRLCAIEFHAGDLEEDLIQEGYFGMLEAIGKYDVKKGFKFLTYASHYIKKSMRRFLIKSRPGIRLPEYMAMNAQKYNRFAAAFVQRYGREPSDLEAEAILNMPDIENVKAAAMNPTSLNASIDEEGTELEEIQGAEDPGYEDVLDSVFMDQLGRELWGYINEMPDQMRDAIVGYYCDGKTYEEIAADLNVSRERVRQLLVKAMRKLRSKKSLRAYYDEIYGRALNGSGVDSFFRTWTSSTERAALWLLGEEIC